MRPDELIALWDFRDPSGSEERFRAVLAAAEDASARLEVQTQIARAMVLQRRFDEAVTLLEGLRPALAAVAPEDEVGRRARVRWFLERGRATSASVHRTAPARALRDFTAAYDHAVQAGEDALAADAAHMAAIVTEGPAGEGWTERGLRIAEASTDPAARNWRGTLLTNRGMARHEQGRFAEALADFEGAFSARVEQGDPERIFVAEWMIAWTLRGLGRHEEALAILDRLEVEAATRGRPDVYVHDEQAENFTALRRDEEAAAARAAADALRRPAGAPI